MTNISRKPATTRPSLGFNRRTRALLLGSLGLIPAACQSPVARFIPIQTIREIGNPAHHSTPKSDAIALEIENNTGNHFTAIESWGRGIGYPVYSVATSSLLISADIFGSSSSHGKPCSYFSELIQFTFYQKVLSYTSGLVDHENARNVQHHNGGTDCADCRR